jgi:hypothetical protein
VICTENMEDKDRRNFDRMLIESEDETEARQVAPLLQAMGGIRPARKKP